MLRNIRSRLISTLVFIPALAIFTHTSAQTLNQAVEDALRTNPKVLGDIANRFTVEEQLNQKKANFLPKVDLTAGYGAERSLNPTSTAIQGSTRIRLNRREASAQLVENLFNGGGDVSEVRRVRSHLHSQAWQVLATSQDVALEVTERYLDVLRCQHLVALARQNLAKHRGIMSMINDRSESGLGRKADDVQTAGRVALAQSNLISEQNNLNNAIIKFERVVGELPRNLRWPKAPSTRSLPHSVYAAIEAAHENHPQLKSITADVASAEQQHRTARSMFLPKIDLVLASTRDRNIDGIRGDNENDYAMVRGSFNVFRGGADLAKSRETAYQIQEANEVRNNTINEMEEHVRLSMAQLRALKNRIVYLRRHRDAMRSAVAARAEQFKVNKGTLLDELDAQNEYYTASMNYYNALHDEMLARFRILNSTGYLLQYLNVQPPVEATVHESRWMHLI